MRKYISRKVPHDLPLWIANVERIRLSRDGEQTVIVIKDKKRTRQRIFWGVGFPLYKLDLRTDTGRTISTEYVRVHTKRYLLDKVRCFWPSVMGIKEI